MPRLRFLLALVALPLALAACDLGDPMEGFTLRFNYSAADASVSARVVDAATREPLAVPVTVTFSGEDAARVVDIQGRRIEALTVSPDGAVAISAFNFGLDGAPSDAAPARVRLRIAAPGYIATAFPLAITDPETSVSVRLVRRDAPPAGVAVAQQTATATAAGTAAAVDLEAGGSAGAGLSIPQGTQLAGADGRPLQGALQADFAYFDPASEDAAEAFPGGFAGASVVGSGGAQSGSFSSAGFVSIHIEDAAGNAVSAYSQPIAVRIPVAPGTRNAATGRPVQAGDAIGVFSLTEAEGVWREEAAATVTLRNGGLVAEFAITHNSYYSVGYFEAGGCATGARVTVTNLPAGSNSFGLRWRLVEDGQRFASGELAGNSVRFRDAPAGRPFTFQVRTADGRVIGERQIPDLCGGDVPLEADLSGFAQTVSVDGHVSVTCPSDDLEVRPSNYTVYYKKTGTAAWSEATMQEGRVVLNGLEDGAEYRFQVQISGEWYGRTLEVRDDVRIEDVDGTITVRRVSQSRYEVRIAFVDTEGSVCS